MKRLALPGSRREGRSGPQPGRAGVQPAAGPPARPQPGQRPQLLPGRPVRPSAAFSGKPSSLPRRPFLLHRRDPRERRGSESPTAAPPPTAPSPALRGRNGRQKLPRRSRDFMASAASPQPAFSAARGAQLQTWQLPLSLQTGTATARVCLQSHSETTAYAGNRA